MNNRDYASPENARKMLRIFNRVYKSGKPSGPKRFEVHRKGRNMIVELSASLIANKQDQSVGFRGLIRDVTDRERAEREKRDFERLQGVLEMAGAICHELNQPLQSIYGYADLLEVNNPQNGSRDRYVDKITEQVGRVKSITGKLMRITKYETVEYLNGSKIIDINKSSAEKAS
jgi:nitrogen-specific signal transduction histidine kinase